MGGSKSYSFDSQSIGGGNYLLRPKKGKSLEQSISGGLGLDVVVEGGSLLVGKPSTVKDDQDQAIIDGNQGKQNLVIGVLRVG
jgi:hypothetical protein